MTESNPLGHAEVLTHLAGIRRAEEVVVATMTSGTLWPSFSQHEMDICSHAPMGMASSMGLGIATARPDLGVIILDADGSILMNLGTLVTVGGNRPAKFLHIVFENGVYDMTGGQALPGSGTSGVPAMAEAAGYTRAQRSTDLEDLDRAVDEMRNGEGPILLMIPATRDFADINLSEVANQPAATQRIGASGFANLRSAIAAQPR